MSDPNANIKFGVMVLAGAAVAYIMYKQYQKFYSMQKDETNACRDLLQSIKQQCSTPKELLRKVANAMVQKMHEGLKVRSGARLKMLESYVDKLPTG